MDLRFEPDHVAASQARKQVRSFLEAFHVPSQLTADVELVVAELAANAVEHGPGGPIELEVLLSAPAVFLTVTNARHSDEPIVLPARPDAEPLADRGRGLAIVDALVSGMWVHGDQGCTSVSCMIEPQT